MELARFPSHGGFSVRSIFTFVLAVVAAALLWATFGSTPTHAADASWSSGSIVHANHLYKKMEAKDIPAGIPADASVYTYTPTAANGSDNKEAFFIYFASGVDPPTATSANYVAYDYDISSKTYSNPHDSRTISIADDAAKDGSLSSCSVQGIGWIVCPVTVFLADGMDVMFDTLAKYFLQVQPLLSTNDNGLHTAWTIMQTIANIAFVIVFLIIIYSQLTNYGISNYGLKRLLPRLIIAAILVNLSFTIAAAAIDISNILGYSIQNIFEAIRKDTFHMTNETWGSGLNNGWSALAAGVLAGGGAVVGGMYAVSSGAYMLLIPLVVLLAVTLFLVLVVLAARQAIIIILVVIAPLAFVANLLPNTEKWFGKWRDTFMTMLIFFPAFSLAFGGSQLAGQVIIMNAGDNIIMVIFGMAVQIAPLVITPLLFKLSGGILGKIAQIANNPNKGLLDRNKKWAHDMAEKKRLGAAGRDLSNKNKFNPSTWGARMVKGNEFRRRDLANKIERNKHATDARYLERDKYQKLHDQMHEAEMDKKLAQGKVDEHSQKHVLTDKRLLEKDMKIRIVEDRVVELKGRIDASYDELKSGQTTMSSRYGAQFAALETEAAETARNIALNGARQQAAKRAQTEAYYQGLKDNTATFDGQQLRTYAGGVQGHVGAQRALAQAIGEQHKAHQEIISNANAILDDYNLDAGDNLNIAKNISVRGIDITEDIREAAIKRVASNGVIPHIDELLTSVDFSNTGNENYRTALVEALKTNANRPKYIGFGTLDKLTQGIDGGITSSTIDSWIESTLIDGKMSAKELASQDKDTLKRIMEALPRLVATPGRSLEDQGKFENALSALQDEIHAAKSDEILWNASGERKPTIRLMSSFLEGATGKPAIRDESDSPTAR